MVLGAVLLAAGQGTRYKEKKQDVLFHSKPLWRYPFDILLKFIDRANIIVVGKDIQGGKTRTESVILGLNKLRENTERVIIAEAARPMVNERQITQLLYDIHPSVSFVKPLVDTVVYRDGEYINRDDLYDLLTPQAFDYKMLVEAYRSNRFIDMTDETRVMYEYFQIKPFFIETGTNLFKVTYPGDINMIEEIYRQQIEDGLI